jgi:antirestriction protein ArdC
MTKKAESNRIDIYTRITDRIVEDLEQGVRPWMKPWSAANTRVGLPGRCATMASPIPA